MSSLDKLRKLTRQLFPRGRAFNIAQNSVKQKIFDALSLTENDFVNAADSVLWHILPDNPNFTIYDATIWEIRLGINTSPLTSLDDRKAAIIQKLNHPGNVLARQSVGFLQQQLQLAGFDVYVYENQPEQLPSDVFGVGLSGIAEHSPLVQHMQTGMEHGSLNLWNDVIANHIDYQKDEYFDPGSLNRTFFICGNTLGTFANIPSVRREEFRQLVLSLKRAKAVAYLGINYV